MKVYDFEGFPNPARVRMALAEKGALSAVEFVTINVPEGEHRGAAFKAKNPSAAVPVLELDDGTTISECTAITEYIDDHFEGPSLCGRGGRQRSLVHMMQRRAESEVLDAVGGYFHHATPGLGPALETEQFDSWGQAQARRATAGMRYFDSVLTEQPFVAGEAYSMADITLFAGLAFADFANVEIPAECAALSAWRERVAQRPALNQPEG